MSGDYGEPFRINSLGPRTLELRNASGVLISRRSGDAGFELMRLKECANALAGIADPAAFVQRAKAMEVWLYRKADAPGFEFDMTPEAIAALAAEWKEDE